MSNNPVEKKKGLFGSIAGVFVERVPTAEPSITPAPITSPSPASISQIDQDILKQLYGVLEDNNMPGYDYFEFRGAVENMKSVITDESGRMKAVFTAISSMTTVDKLISSADFYLAKLDEHSRNFEAFSKKVSQEKVISKENKVKTIEVTLAEKSKAITKLQEEMAKMQEEKILLLTEAASERVKIETVQANFTVTYNKIVEDIKADRNKIATCLQGVK